MDVTLPTGVATVAGTPPAGGVPDVLAQLAGTDGTSASDAFAELLAALDLGGVDAAEGSVAGKDCVDPDTAPAPDATAAALAASGLGIVSQPVVAPVVLVTDAAGGEAAAVSPSTAERVDPNLGSAVAADGRSTTNAAATGAAQDSGLLAETAEAVHAASPREPRHPRRVAASDAAATSAPAKESIPTGSTERPVAATAEAAAGSTLSVHDAQTQGNVKAGAPVHGHDPSQRPREGVPVEVTPEQQKAASQLDTAALKVEEPTALLRRHEQAPTQSDAGPHPTGAESLTNAPRPVTSGAPATPRSDASTAYRHAEAGTLPETSRPLGRLPDGGEMRLEVSPEGLGPIEIRVAVRNDAVQASLWTQQDHARAALEAHRPMLADALGRSSLRLEEFTVGVGQHHHAAQDDDRTPRRWANPLAAEPAAAAPTTTHAPVRTRGLSLRA